MPTLGWQSYTFPGVASHPDFKAMSRADQVKGVGARLHAPLADPFLKGRR